MVVFVAETGLRTNESVALERRDVDRAGAAVTVQRRFADGRLAPYLKTIASRRRVPLSDLAVDSEDAIRARLNARRGQMGVGSASDEDR